MRLLLVLIFIFAPLAYAEEEELEKRIPEINADLIYSAGYIIPEDVPKGKIINYSDENTSKSPTIFSEGDKVYVQIDPKGKIKIGDKFSVYRIIRPVTHPDSGEDKGFLIDILGKGVISTIGEERSILKIVQSYGGIAIGDKLMDEHDSKLPGEGKSNVLGYNKIHGQIIEAKQHKEINGQNDIVYLDQGKDKGISPGDSFIVYRYSNTSEKTKLGKIKILSVKDNTSTALITRAREEVFISEQVESVGNNK